MCHIVLFLVFLKCSVVRFKYVFGDMVRFETSEILHVNHLPLFDCLTNVKAWMASDPLNFNEDKTEDIIFGRRGNCSTSLTDLGSLEALVKSTITW